MGKFAERLKQSIDSRLPHFSTSIPYVIATVLIMLVPLTVVLSQQETRIRSRAAPYIPGIVVTVKDAQTGAGLENAFASLEGGEKSCHTDSFGGCKIPDTGKGTFTVYVIKGGYDPLSKPVTVGGGNESEIFELTPAEQTPVTPTKSPDESEPPSDNTRDPDTGGPKDDTDTPDDSGSNPPGPDDLKCLGSCETPTPTPPYCITPAPNGDTPPDTGTPSPDTQSIFDMVRQRINEAFSRFGDFFKTNPGNSPTR